MKNPQATTVDDTFRRLTGKLQVKDISDLLVCQHVQRWKDAQDRNTPWPYETIAAETGCVEKVAYKAMERACERDYIEYGTSLRTGWLTKKGKDLLNDPQNHVGGDHE